MVELAGTPLVAGEASGPVLKLGEPLSFWGGLDAGTGRIVGRHGAAGTSVTGTVLVMPSGRGSSSSSSVLAEAVGLGTAPKAIVLGEYDAIVALGSMVAYELYGVVCPVVVVAADDLERIPHGAVLTIERDGTVRV